MQPRRVDLRHDEDALPHISHPRSDGMAGTSCLFYGGGIVLRTSGFPLPGRKDVVQDDEPTDTEMRQSAHQVIERNFPQVKAVDIDDVEGPILSWQRRNPILRLREFVHNVPNAQLKWLRERIYGELVVGINCAKGLACSDPNFKIRPWTGSRSTEKVDEFGRSAETLQRPSSKGSD